MKINIELSQEAKATIAAMDHLPPAALAGMVKAMDYENALTVSHIQQAYLSFPKHGPTVPIGLRIQTNRLRGSIRASKSGIEGQTVVSAIGSNVEYARRPRAAASPTLERMNSAPPYRRTPSLRRAALCISSSGTAKSSPNRCSSPARNSRRGDLSSAALVTVPPIIPRPLAWRLKGRLKHESNADKSHRHD